MDLQYSGCKRYAFWKAEPSDNTYLVDLKEKLYINGKVCIPMDVEQVKEIMQDVKNKFLKIPLHPYDKEFLLDAGVSPAWFFDDDDVSIREEALKRAGLT